MGFLIFKICLVCILAIIIRGTLPRYRIDQLSLINWKNIIYIYIAFTVYFVFTQYGVFLFINI